MNHQGRRHSPRRWILPSNERGRLLAGLLGLLGVAPPPTAYQAQMPLAVPCSHATAALAAGRPAAHSQMPLAAPCSHTTGDANLLRQVPNYELSVARHTGRAVLTPALPVNGITPAWTPTPLVADGDPLST
jgi:hypothetical protein